MKQPRRPFPSLSALVALSALLLFAGCRTYPGKPALRKGDEIVVAGQLFHTGTPVVTWMDAGGYDAYRVERRFSPFAESSYEKTIAAVKAKIASLQASLPQGVEIVSTYDRSSLIDWLRNRSMSGPALKFLELLQAHDATLAA